MALLAKTYFDTDIFLTKEGKYEVSISDISCYCYDDDNYNLAESDLVEVEVCCRNDEAAMNGFNPNNYLTNSFAGCFNVTKEDILNIIKALKDYLKGEDVDLFVNGIDNVGWIKIKTDACYLVYEFGVVDKNNKTISTGSYYEDDEIERVVQELCDLIS